MACPQMQERQSTRQRCRLGTDQLAATAARVESVGRRALAAARRGPGGGTRRGLRPAARARRGAREMDERARVPSPSMEGQLRAHARSRARPRRGAPSSRLGDGAPAPSDRRARRNADRAHLPPRGAPGRRERRSREPSEDEDDDAEEAGEELDDEEVEDRGRSRRGAAVPLSPSDRVREDDRGRRLRRGCADDGRPHPDASAASRQPVHARPDRRGVRHRASAIPCSRASTRSAATP